MYVTGSFSFESQTIYLAPYMDLVCQLQALSPKRSWPILLKGLP